MTLLALLFLTAAARADSQATYLECLTNFETYAETIWHPATYSGAPVDAGYWGDGTSYSDNNGGIRGNSGIAVAYAVMVLAQPGNSRNALRQARIRQALNYDAATHLTGTNVCVDSAKWGWSNAISGDWQTPLWAGSMGLACLLGQHYLPASTTAGVQRAVASEATHRAGIPPRGGYDGDTKAEENAWDSNILALGAAWMSTNANATLWLNAAKSYLVNTYTVADTNGDPLAVWIDTTNLFPSYALENHGFYHPTYEMVSGMSLGDSLLMAQLANPSVAAELRPFAEHNFMQVWTNNLDDVIMDSGEFAYPSGLDWELHDYEQDSYVAWIAAHFNDPLARWADGQISQLVRQRQIVNGNGMLVGPSVGGGHGDPFFREAVEARRTAIAWLQWANADYPTGPANSPTPNQAYFTDVDIIAHRSAFGFFSVSFGPRIMAMLEPTAPDTFPTNVFLTTPQLPGMIGIGAQGAPANAILVNYSTNAEGFSAEFTLQYTNAGATEVYVKDCGESVGIVEVPWPTNVNAAVAGSFEVGIENDPLSGGSRLIEWSDDSKIVTNMSGVNFNVTNSWICVGGRYGMAAGPAGYFNYQAPTGYNRAGGAQDILQFYPSNSLAPRYAVWFPGKDAIQSSNVTAQISWRVAGTNAVLYFPGAGEIPQQIFARVPVSPPYPPYIVPVGAIDASSYQANYPPTNAVDGNYSTFWTSSGVNPGDGPTTNHPEWLRFTFPRIVAVSEFQIWPRTFNGGYGPKSVEMLLNNSVVYSGIMSPTNTLTVPLTPPVYTTNAELLITSSYDPACPTNSRNVQAIETAFFERAKPNTFGDWELRNFSEAQLSDSSVGCPTADPDGDGIPNLLEFAVGGNPLVADATNFAIFASALSNKEVEIHFRERNSLGDIQRKFDTSRDLFNWTNAIPLSNGIVTNLGVVSINAVTFLIDRSSAFYWIRYAY